MGRQGESDLAWHRRSTDVPQHQRSRFPLLSRLVGGSSSCPSPVQLGGGAPEPSCGSGAICVLLESFLSRGSPRYAHFASSGVSSLLNALYDQLIIFLFPPAVQRPKRPALDIVAAALRPIPTGDVAFLLAMQVVLCRRALCRESAWRCMRRCLWGPPAPRGEVECAQYTSPPGPPSCYLHLESAVKIGQRADSFAAVSAAPPL